MAVPNLGELSALTRDYVSRRLSDNVFLSNVIFERLRQNEETYDGGEKIREPIIYDDDPADTTGGSFTRTQTINNVEREGVDAAQYDPAFYYQTIVLWDQDLAKNGRGDTQLLSLHDARVQTAELRLRGRFSRHFFGTAAGTPNILGSLDLFSSTNTYGGISRSSQSFWRPVIQNNAGTGRALTLRILDNLYEAVHDAEIRPTIGITSTEVIAKYKSLLHPQQRFMNNEEMTRAGFLNVMFNDVPLVVDKRIDQDSATRQKMYFFNLDFFKLRPHEDYNFKTDDWTKMQSGAGIYTRIWWFGQVTCNNCRYQGSLEDIDPATA